MIIANKPARTAGFWYLLMAIFLFSCLQGDHLLGHFDGRKCWSDLVHRMALYLEAREARTNAVAG